MEFSAWYPKGMDFILFAYLYYNWAQCVDDRKSTSDGAFYLGQNILS